MWRRWREAGEWLPQPEAKNTLTCMQAPSRDPPTSGETKHDLTAEENDETTREEQKQARSHLFILYLWIVS